MNDFTPAINGHFQTRGLKRIDLKRTNLAEFLKIEHKKIEIQHHAGEKKDLPCLVFLHEGLGCAGMWKNFPGLLSQRTGCPALVFSRFGYGGSDPSPLPWKLNFMHDQALRTLPDILGQAQIKDHILIGHSDGGSISIIYAGSPSAPQKKRLKGVITMAAHVFCEPITVSCIRQAKINYETQGLKQGLEKYHGKNTDNAFYGWNDIWLNPRFIHWNIEKYLGRIRVPMLALQGRDDQYGTLRQIAAIRSRVREIQTHIIDDCRHSPHLEQPEKVLDIMTAFVREILSDKNRAG